MARFAVVFVLVIAGAVSPASANPTAYDVSALLRQRDVFADRFWGLLQAPVAPAAAPGVGNRLYDFAPMLRGPDPFANAFWGVGAPAQAGRP